MRASAVSVLTPPVVLYLALTLTLAALMMTHAVLLFRVLRSRRLGGRSKLWAVVPPAIPYLAFRSGRRVGAILWAVLAIAYTTLLLLAHA